MSEMEQGGLRQRWTAAMLIVAAIVLLATVTMIVPVSEVTAHNILHHLNFLPLMIAGMLFGWRGAALSTFCAGLVNAPLIAQHWMRWPVDAKDQIVELSIFSVAGLIAGYLSDRERAQRRDVERIGKELEKVYHELRENIVEMKKAERLSAAGRLAASLAHEIRNPLAGISGAAGILQRGAAPAEYKEESLEIIQKESQRLNKLLTGFLNFANPRSLRLQRTDMSALLASVVSMASHSERAGRIVFEDSSHPEDEVECDPEQIKQVLLNLVINAVEASPVGAVIQLRSKRKSGQITIEVEDRGSGISDAIMEQIYDPFFTTKATGTGLGLAISSMIVSQHNGALSFTKNANGGTTFCVELPVKHEGAHAH
ncbi:MAG TPA: ATP-binding protein [Acidobacteriaceae bacterium]|nr:ATP-binding protein [Acidobacteriaceae bacterium]